MHAAFQARPKWHAYENKAAGAPGLAAGGNGPPSPLLRGGGQRQLVRGASQQQASLVASCRGAGGGSVVAKSADIITFTMHMPQLLTIRRAVLGRHTGHRADGINITPIIGDYANDLFQDEEQALLKSDQPKGKL